MKRYSYRQTHLPSGRTGVSEVIMEAQSAFHGILAHWNQMGGTTWKYDEIPGSTPIPLTHEEIKKAFFLSGSPYHTWSLNPVLCNNVSL